MRNCYHCSLQHLIIHIICLSSVCTLFVSLSVYYTSPFPCSITVPTTQQVQQQISASSDSNATAAKSRILFPGFSSQSCLMMFTVPPCSECLPCYCHAMLLHCLPCHQNAMLLQCRFTTMPSHYNAVLLQCDVTAMPRHYNSVLLQCLLYYLLM